MKTLFIIVPFLILSSCSLLLDVLYDEDSPRSKSPKETFEENLNVLVGLSEESLIRSLGVPDKFYEAGNTKIITYIKNTGTKYSTTNNQAKRNFNNNYLCKDNPYCLDVPYKEQTVRKDYFCEITFNLYNNLITETSYKGNSCY